MKRDNSVCSGLAGILAFALVLGKLDPETLLRVRNPLHCLHWNVELTIAKSADADSRECAQPFEDPKITFRHFPTQVRHAGQVPTTHGQSANRSPHAGHSIRSKSTRRISAGEIAFPHFGHTASRDACTLSRLILRDLDIG